MCSMKPETTTSFSRRYLVLAVLLVLALYVLVPQIGAFRSSWAVLGQLTIAWVIIAIGLTALTYLAGALNYYLLAIKRLRYGPTVLVQFAAMFINRLLPAGLGAIGANYAYLKRQRHSGAQAATVVAMNNLLGAVGHALVVAIVLLAFSGRRTALLPSYGHLAGSVLKVAALALLILGGLAVALGWHRFRRRLTSLRLQALSYRQRSWRLSGALLSSTALTLANVFCLLACGLAVGVSLPFVVVLLVFTFGVGAGTATPVPGGLGGFEAGLTAGFVAYHVAAPAALAAALLYRLVSYWLPLGFGGLAFVVSQRRNLL